MTVEEVVDLAALRDGQSGLGPASFCNFSLLSTVYSLVNHFRSFGLMCHSGARDFLKRRESTAL